MGDLTLHRLSRIAWELARSQHWVIAHWQLADLGFSAKAIKHRVAKGRLRPVHRGVYAVGRPELTCEGRFMAAVLRCGPGAALSHISAGVLWRILNGGMWRGVATGPIHVSLHAAVVRQPPGIRVHRRRSLTESDLTTHRGIPTTTSTRTLIDLGTVLSQKQLEAAVNEADVLDLIDPETLRADLERRKGQPGTRPLRALLDRATYRMTETELERRFLRLVKRAGLPLPETQVQLAGRVDFHWPSVGLVVETDGWRYHRTPARQAADNRRMQAHAAGRTAVRVSHYEVRHEAERVEGLLSDLVRRRAA
jgi:very-short-patch-repair endonuclease